MDFICNKIGTTGIVRDKRYFVLCVFVLSGFHCTSVSFKLFMDNIILWNTQDSLYTLIVS